MTKCYRCASSGRDTTELLNQAYFSVVYTLPSPNICRPFDSRKIFIKRKIMRFTPLALYDNITLLALTRKFWDCNLRVNCNWKQINWAPTETTGLYNCEKVNLQLPHKTFYSFFGHSNFLKDKVLYTVFLLMKIFYILARANCISRTKCVLIVRYTTLLNSTGLHQSLFSSDLLMYTRHNKFCTIHNTHM